MGEKCKPNYKNLNTIQSYSEQKYATVQWCEQNCENDEWLRQQVEQLRYLSPPAVRKNFNITQFLDEKKSYSCRGNGLNQVIFDNTTKKTVIIDFRDIPNQIDEANTTAEIKNDNPTFNDETASDDNETLTFDEDGNVVDDEGEVQVLRCRLPSTIDTHEEEAVVKDFGTSKENTKVNSYWYVGWDKDKNYYLTANWLKNWKHCDIKSVARAQTFVAKESGRLNEVSLALAWNGNQSASCGSPLYVQLWNTYKDYVEKSTWDNSNLQMAYSYKKFSKLSTANQKIYKNRKRYSPYKVNKKYKTGKKKGQVVKKKKNGKWVTQTETKWKEDKNGEYVRELTKVYRPGHNKKGSDGKYKSNIHNPLAEAVYTKVGEPYPTIKFDTPYEIKKGNHYALVLFSPLSIWSHCPRWGGWGRNCKNDKAYSDGHAFISKNNGRNWSIYGKNGTDTYNKKALPYKKGKFTPQDFAFECHVETKSAQTVEDGIHYSDKPHYLYLKPIYSNPITSVKLSAECEGTETTDNRTFIDFEVSTDGVEWTPIDNLGTVNFTPNENGEYSQILLVRATLYRNPSDEYKSETPFIEKIELEINSTLPKTMYARTSFYKPVMTPMLKGNLWGRVYAPFKVDETVSCKAEIIQGNDVKEHFNIIDQDHLDETLYQLLHDDDEDNDSIMNDFSDAKVSISSILSKKGDARAEALTTNHQILEVLKKYNIYIKPYLHTSGLKLYLLSFSASYDNSDMIATREKVHETISTSTSTTGEELEGDDAETKLDSADDINATPTEAYEFDFEIGGVKFNDNVAYPILSFNGETPSQEDGASVDSYTEGIDYTFDYENNILYLKRHTLDSLVEETWEVTYNKVFVGDLTSTELGKYLDETTGLRNDGFVLDYHKEKIVVTSDHVTSRRVKLRMEPTDPIRQVILYHKDDVTGDYNDGVELFEDTDFTFDIDTKELNFTINTTDGVSTVLSLGDTLEIVYTPYLTDDSLAIGYYATRKNTDKQCYIDNVYFEYKV